MYYIDKTIYYYLILFATLLFTFSFIPIVFEVIEQKITSNLPYISLIFMFVSFLIFLFITIHRGYYVHILLYFIALTGISIILFLKRTYDSNNIMIEKTINNYIIQS